jgi:hypothetical protein
MCSLRIDVLWFFEKRDCATLRVGRSPMSVEERRREVRRRDRRGTRGMKEGMKRVRMEDCFGVQAY